MFGRQQKSTKYNSSIVFFTKFIVNEQEKFTFIDHDFYVIELIII